MLNFEYLFLRPFNLWPSVKAMDLKIQEIYTNCLEYFLLTDALCEKCKSLLLKYPIKCKIFQNMELHSMFSSIFC